MHLAETSTTVFIHHYEEERRRKNAKQPLEKQRMKRMKRRIQQRI